MYTVFLYFAPPPSSRSLDLWISWRSVHSTKLAFIELERKSAGVHAWGGCGRQQVTTMALTHVNGGTTAVAIHDRVTTCHVLHVHASCKGVCTGVSQF